MFEAFWIFKVPFLTVLVCPSWLRLGPVPKIGLCFCSYFLVRICVFELVHGVSHLWEGYRLKHYHSAHCNGSLLPSVYHMFSVLCLLVQILFRAYYCNCWHFWKCIVDTYGVSCIVWLLNSVTRLNLHGMSRLLDMCLTHFTNWLLLHICKVYTRLHAMLLPCCLWWIFQGCLVLKYLLAKGWFIDCPWFGIRLRWYCTWVFFPVRLQGWCCIDWEEFAERSFISSC